MIKYFVVRTGAVISSHCKCPSLGTRTEEIDWKQDIPYYYSKYYVGSSIPYATMEVE